MTYEISVKSKKQVHKVKVSAQVRYWEDSSVNGEMDEYGKLIPLRNGDLWGPIIDLESGSIEKWPKGTAAEIHYKVCDCGVYSLLDSEGVVVVEKDGYVPNFLSPGGYGDYLIMSIDGTGKIKNFRFSAEYWENDDE